MRIVMLDPPRRSCRHRSRGNRRFESFPFENETSHCCERQRLNSNVDTIPGDIKSHCLRNSRVNVTGLRRRSGLLALTPGT